MVQKILHTKHLQIVSLILFIALFMTACGAQKPDDLLIETTWQWNQLVETNPTGQSVVPDPENYTLTLSSDGSLSIKADCNMVMGTYLIEKDSLTIELGPSTMAFCGENSLDQQYLELLNNVEHYAIEDGILVLSLENNGGQMAFHQE